MTAISKIICVFSLAIGFAFGGAAQSPLRKPKLINSNEIKVNNEGARVLQTVEYVCDEENVALALCTVLNTACYNAATDLVIPGLNWCALSSEVDTFCEGAQKMITECDQECHDEAQALTACMLKEGGCDEDHCSSSSGPDYKVYAVIVVVGLAAVAIVYWIHKRRRSNHEKGQGK